jgi:hypothetical protein
MFIGIHTYMIFGSNEIFESFNGGSGIWMTQKLNLRTKNG